MKKIPKGTEVFVDRSAIPVRKWIPYDLGDPRGLPVIGVVDNDAEVWDDGEFRYSIRFGDAKTIYPVKHSKLTIKK